MTTAAMNADPMVAIVMLSTPESVGMVRGQVRAALEYGGLGAYADDAELIASELVSNAVRHGSTGQEDKITVALIRVTNPSGVAVIVIDSSSNPPVMRELTLEDEGGRGLRIVDALAASWDWRPKGQGKAVIAILANDGLLGAVHEPVPAERPARLTAVRKGKRVRRPIVGLQLTAMDATGA
jgi:anti-sigma regulatory factor (Ser/Thr protein kinase)